MGMGIEYEARVDTAGYEIRAGRIVGRGGKVEARYPLLGKNGDKLFWRFAALKTPDEILAFIGQTGPIGLYGDDLGMIAQAITHMAVGIKAANSRNPTDRSGLFQREGAKVANVTAYAPWDDVRRRHDVVLRANTLMDAMWLQLAMLCAGGNGEPRTLKTCPHCGRPFWAGKGQERPANAEFCSPEHKRRHLSLARSSKSKARRKK